MSCPIVSLLLDPVSIHFGAGFFLDECAICVMDYALA